MIRFRYLGDIEEAKKLVHFARKQMNILEDQMKLSVIWSDSSKFYDEVLGVEIKCYIISGRKYVEIYVPPVKKKEEEEEELFVHRYALFALGIASAPERTKYATYAGFSYPYLFVLYDIDNEEVVRDEDGKYIFEQEELEALEEMKGVKVWGDSLELYGGNLSTETQAVSFTAVNIDGGRFDYQGSMVLGNAVTPDVTGYVEFCESGGKPSIAPSLTEGAYVPRLNFLWTYSDSEEDSVTWTGEIEDCESSDTYAATARHTCAVTGLRGCYVCSPPVAFQVYCYDVVDCTPPNGSSYPCYVATFGTLSNDSDWFRAAHYEPVTSLKLTDHLGNYAYLGTTVMQHEEDGEEVDFNGLTIPYEVYRYDKQTNEYSMSCPGGELLESVTLRPVGTCETWSGYYSGASVYDSSGEDRQYIYLYSSLAKARYMTTNDDAVYCSKDEVTENAAVAIAIYFGQYNTLTQEWIGPVAPRQCEFAPFVEAEVGNRSSNVKVYMSMSLASGEEVSPFSLPHRGDVESALSAMIEQKYGDDLTDVDNHLDIEVNLFGIRVGEECE